jgi:hypothetical protein
LIVCEREDERLWPGQSGQLLERLNGRAERLGCASGTPYDAALIDRLAASLESRNNPKALNDPEDGR